MNTHIWKTPTAIEIPNTFRVAIGGHPLVAELLWRRGIQDIQQAQAFMNPRLYQPSSAWALPDMEQAAARVGLAIERGERVGIWGDFDVDGQTATALLVSALDDAGLKVTSYIPDRETEGHGVYVPKLRQWIMEQGLSLVITCDTGIAAHAAVDAAHEMGVDVVITDHHQLPDALPDALARVNPQRLEIGHPLRTLAGVGVAYKLIEAVFERLGQDLTTTDAYLDLVALGLIADVALLVDDTRFLVQRGLDQLRLTRRLGLQALCEAAGLDISTLDERDVAFSIAPRLNALGRLGDANLGVELLNTQDTERARLLANQLEGLNNHRRMLTKQVYGAAESLIQRDPSLLNYNALVVAHPHWPGGVIGIVANQLAETYRRPAVLISIVDKIGRGSARSVDGVDITAALHTQQHILSRYGGHTMAAGLTLDAERVGEFRRGLSHSIGAVMEVVTTPTLSIDAFVSLRDVDLSLVQDVRRLAPFGAGNPAPVLASDGLSIVRQRKIGRHGEHLAFTVEDGHGHQREVMWWGQDEELVADGPIDLAFSARVNRYKGETQLQLEYVDLRVLEPQIAQSRKVARVFIDCRATPDACLAEARQKHTSIAIWHEGENSIPEGLRYALVPSKVLVIWSAPPSYQIMAEVLARVNPHYVYVALSDTPTPIAATLVQRIGGLAKYAITHLEGKVDLERAAAKLGITSKLMILGLNYWVFQSKIRIVSKQEGVWDIDYGVEAKSMVAGNSETILSQMNVLLAEIEAFRSYLLKTPVERLFATAR